MFVKFTYKYPSPDIDTTIIVETVNDEIITCKWNSSIKQWVDIRQPLTPGTVSYLENDVRLKDGIVNWCYMKDFKKFMIDSKRLKIEV